MRTLMACSIVALAFLTVATPAAAQAPVAPAPSCLSDWSCGPGRAPLGLYVRAVDGGGRWVTLEDGSVWEVEISDRATSGSWQSDDFVGIRPIAAPRADYEHLLTRVGDLTQHAAVRLAGRRVPAFRADDAAPGGGAE